MSHLVKMKLKVNDLDTLEASCKSLGLELVRGQKQYKWFGRSVGDYPLPQGFSTADLGKCDHAIRIPGNERAYEVGVCARRDGQPGFELLWDFWAGGYGLVDKVGQDGALLEHEYAIQTTVSQFITEGYQVHVGRQEDGTAVVMATE